MRLPKKGLGGTRLCEAIGVHCQRPIFYRRVDPLSDRALARRTKRHEVGQEMIVAGMCAIGEGSELGVVDKIGGCSLGGPCHR